MDCSRRGRKAGAHGVLLSYLRLPRKDSSCLERVREERGREPETQSGGEVLAGWRCTKNFLVKYLSRGDPPWLILYFYSRRLRFPNGFLHFFSISILSVPLPVCHDSYPWPEGRLGNALQGPNIWPESDALGEDWRDSMIELFRYEETQVEKRGASFTLEIPTACTLFWIPGCCFARHACMNVGRKEDRRNTKY